MIVPTELVAIQARRGMQTTELARRSTVSRSMLNDARSGRCEFSDASAHRVAAALDCAVEDFTRPLTATERAHRDEVTSRRRINLATNRNQHDDGRDVA